MFLLLILPILVSGFLLCHIHPIYKLKLHRYEGQFLYLKCAQYGLILILLAGGVLYFWSGQVNLYFAKFNIISLLTSRLSEVVGTDKNNLYAREMAYLVILNVLSIICAFLWSFLSFIRLCIKYKKVKYKLNIMSQIFKDSPLDDFLFKSSVSKTKESAIVMITMKDRKVYVGNIITLGEPSETEAPDQEIKIVPWMSGYRDKDNLTVTFTTYYEILSQKPTTILVQSEIISATNFMIKEYNKFKEVEKKGAYSLMEVISLIFKGVKK